MSLSQEDVLAAARDDIARADWLVGTAVDGMKLALTDSSVSEMVLLATLTQYVYENVEQDFVPLAFAVAVLKLVRAMESEPA